jgi:putative endonuclease
MRGGYVYIMTNKLQSTLYRIYERYDLKHLAHYEFFDDIRNALLREKNFEYWPRLWKLALIQETNPDWSDLYERLNS